MALASIARSRSKAGVADRLASSLRTAIVGGRLRPGDALPSERELADQYEVNRSSVREAMKRLEAWGLVKIRHGGATRVSDFLLSAGLELLPFLVEADGPVDASVLRELHEIRAMLLGWCAEQAAVKADPASIARLETLARQLAGSRGRPSESQELDYDFFEALVQITGNRPLLLFANVVRGVYLRGRERFLGLYAKEVFDPRLHQRAVDAIRAHDSQAAGAAMREHAATALAAKGGKAMIRSEPEAGPNVLRYSGAPGHVESYFLRANDPESPRALWLKITIFAPLEGEAEVESWFVYFDAKRPTPFAGRETSPLRSDAFTEVGGGTRASASRLTFELLDRGHARGEVRTPEGEGRIALSWQPSPSPVAAPLSLIRPRTLREGPFPRSKLLTPFPSLRFSGHLDVGDERVDVKDWPGMQGHNWGREHAFEYAWGQCLFPESKSGPEAMLEGFSARVRLGGGQLTPRISCLVVRRGDQTLRFDRLFDLWRQDAELTADRWTLRLHGSDGEARLEMDAGGRPIACLGYRNPDARLSYCFNSKLARVRLQVQPRRGPAFSLQSEHGGALEFLRNDPDPRFTHVV